MKKSLEKSIKTTATPEDLKVIEVIISLMTMYESYYGTFTRLHAEFKYKEYSTLKDDLKCFKREILLNAGKYSVMELASLKRSLILLKDRSIKANINHDDMFFNFLNESILNLDKWLNEVIEVMIQDV